MLSQTNYSLIILSIFSTGLQIVEFWIMLMFQLLRCNLCEDMHNWTEDDDKYTNSVISLLRQVWVSYTQRFVIRALYYQASIILYSYRAQANGIPWADYQYKLLTLSLPSPSLPPSLPSSLCYVTRSPCISRNAQKGKQLFLLCTASRKCIS